MNTPPDQDFPRSESFVDCAGVRRHFELDVRHLPNHGYAAEAREVTRRRLEDLREEQAKPFEYERLTTLLARQRELARELDLDKDEAGTQGLEASEESLAA